MSLSKHKIHMYITIQIVWWLSLVLPKLCHYTHGFESRLGQFFFPNIFSLLDKGYRYILNYIGCFQLLKIQCTYYGANDLAEGQIIKEQKTVQVICDTITIFGINSTRAQLQKTSYIECWFMPITQSKKQHPVGKSTSIHAVDPCRYE